MSETPGPYAVLVTEAAQRQLEAVRKKRGRGAIEQLRAIIGDLSADPEAKTEPLHGVLKGFRSLHSGRFHVVIRIERAAVIVYVVAVGWHESGSRSDVYAALERAVKVGRVRPEQ